MSRSRKGPKRLKIAISRASEPDLWSLTPQATESPAHCQPPNTPLHADRRSASAAGLNSAGGDRCKNSRRFQGRVLPNPIRTGASVRSERATEADWSARSPLRSSHGHEDCTEHGTHDCSFPSLLTSLI